MSGSVLNQIRESNRSFLSGTPKALDSSGRPFVVVACIDPRLTGLLGPAMGLSQNRVSIIRVAGNRIDRSSQDVLRSVATAVYIKGCEEIVVVGHTDCALVTFSASQVIERFRSAGIPREAFGDADLREWFGAFPDIRNNVLDGISVLRNSGLLSANVRIHGAIIDTASGELTIVHDGDVSSAVAPAGASAEGAGQMKSVLPPIASVTTGAPATSPKGLPPALAPDMKVPKDSTAIPAGGVGAATATPPASTEEAAAILAEFFAREIKNPRLRSDVSGFRDLLRKERSPARIFSALEILVRDHVTRYPRVPGAVAFLAKQRNSGGVQGKSIEMLRLILGNL